MARKLNVKELDFIRRYFKHNGDARAAYLEVYNANSLLPKELARRVTALVRRPRVAAEIERIRQAICEETAVSSAEIARELRAVYQEARAKSQLSNALRALELMGKTIGAYTDRVETTKDPIEINLGMVPALGSQEEKINVVKPCSATTYDDSAQAFSLVERKNAETN